MLEFRSKLTANGRIVIPAACRKAMSIEPGEELVIQVEDGEAKLFSINHAIAQAQAFTKKHAKGKGSLTSILFEMRENEAKYE